MQEELANSLSPTDGWAKSAGVAAPAAGHFDPLESGGPLVTLEQQFRDVLDEMDSLRRELSLLRRRDETVNVYLHRIDEELRLAARLQQDFLPRDLPRVGPVQVHALFRPAGYVSGDLYDVTRLDENHLGFYLADAVGHGVPAALLTMFIKHAVVKHDPCQSPPGIVRPGRVMAHLNDVLVGQGLTQATFATAVYGIVDAATLKLTLAKAGHPAPIILRNDGRIEPIDADGSLLGIFPGEVYVESSAFLEPGDRVLVYSDGIEVAFADNDPNPQRWREELLKRRLLPATEFLQDLAGNLDLENGSLAPKDDVTLLLIDITK